MRVQYGRREIATAGLETNVERSKHMFLEVVKNEKRVIILFRSIRLRKWEV